MNNRNLKIEIGSEFWDIPVSKKNNGLFPSDTRWFISGTAALEYIIDDIVKKKNIRTVAIPSWCCNCMITPFIKHGIKVQFYPVYMEDRRLTCNYSSIEADCWIVLSYFGYSSYTSIGSPEGIIIRDLTHSVFTKNRQDAEYYFGSLRKWAGFYTGGYAWCRNWNSDSRIPECDNSYVSLRARAMTEKKSYIEGKSHSKSFLELFEQGEDFLDNCETMGAYRQDIEKARLLNVKGIKEQRRNNALVLLSSLNQWAIFPELGEDDCPLFVPILLDKEKRNALQNHLKSRSIYCPVHWPIEKEHVLTGKTRPLYERELSIVCDQRYDEEDMLRILRVIDESGVI